MKIIKSHIWEREENEHYVEPAWCSERLFDEESFDPTIWDPCCGFGRIPEAAKSHGIRCYASDLIDRGYAGLDQVCDFFKFELHYADQSIVCNPPFNIVKEFALHALTLADKVAMILPAPRLNAADKWMKSTPLKTVWLMTPRPSMPPGHVIASGQKPKGGKVDYAWCVWERGFVGAPELKWLRRDKQLEEAA